MTLSIANLVAKIAAFAIASLCNSPLHGFVLGSGPIVIANSDGLPYAIGVVIG